MQHTQHPSNKTPVNVVVGVLTFRRPDGISKLLDGLLHLHKSPERPYNLTVVVVDNDAAGSSREVVERFAENGVYRLIYVVETQQGIPFARNRAMDEAPEGTDLFCFVDDDEWTVNEWMDALLQTREKTGADCLHGPVIPVFPDVRPEYFVKAKVFEARSHAEGERISYAASNNVMFDLPLFRRHGLRFEEKMRFTGGTDFLFFDQAHRKDLKIVWSDRAVVYDIIPLSRMTWKWVLQRQYRLGNTFAVSDALLGTTGKKIYRVAYGVARMGLGAVMLPALVFSPRWGMRSLTHILRGAGMVSGMMGHSYQEYAPTRLEGSKAS